MSMTPDQYKAIENALQNCLATAHVCLFDQSLLDDFLQQLSKQHAGVSVSSIHSWLRNCHVIHVKTTTAAIRSSIPTIIQRYQQDDTLTIPNLAQQYNYPSYLLARLMVREMTTLGTSSNNNRTLTTALRHPRTHITADLFFNKQSVNIDRFLADIETVLLTDPFYGPRHDIVRHNIGMEYEVVLEFQLKKFVGLSFDTEAQLRQRGTARTPDIVFHYPVGVPVSRSSAISSTATFCTKTTNHSNHDPTNKDDDDDNWKMICWIDSKALFGDLVTHNKSVLPQAHTYVHRFGPGLILYWFGMCPLLEPSQDVHVLDALPSVFLLPTGEILTANSYR